VTTKATTDSIRRRNARRSVRFDARCAGVDGCLAGWVVATRDGAWVVESIAELIAMNFSVIGIDMPIGLPNEELRACESLARRFISPRGSTIFPTPPRACLDAIDYSHACEIARSITGKAISKQAWNILPKIKELDIVVATAASDRIIEVHPECSFTAMNDNRVLPPKRTTDGIAMRSASIERVFGTTPTALKGARRDDILDAYAVLWTAERFARGDHQVLPETTEQRDHRGVPMRIVV
jgi:predicted RNase H-like nuclease